MSEDGKDCTGDKSIYLPLLVDEFTFRLVTVWAVMSHQVE